MQLLFCALLFTFLGINGSELSNKFYGECSKPSTICRGFGPTKNCISSKSCSYASSLFENSTHILINSYQYSNFTKNTEVPCTISGTVINDVEEITKYLPGKGWMTRLECKRIISGQDFATFLHVNPNACRFNDTTWTLKKEADSSSLIDKAFLQSNCEARLGSISSSNTIYQSIEGLPYRIHGASFNAWCGGATDPDTTSGSNWSWGKVLKDLRKYDEGFYSDAEQGREIACERIMSQGLDFLNLY